MHPYLALSETDRRKLCHSFENEFGIEPAVIEKDIWVCIMLDYLFNRSEWKDHLVFKGGTSLSKAFHIIERFSEDIDIILDWRMLGCKQDGSDNDPWAERSKSKQDKFVKTINQKTISLLAEKFLPTLNGEVERMSGIVNTVLIPDSALKSGPLLLFQYPRLFDSDSILPEIRLEIGALAAWGNPVKMEVNSLISECNSAIFPNTSILLPTIPLERAFWEKATIAHKEAHRGASSELPPRYARHYYDLHCMYNSPHFNQISADIDTLKEVLAFNDKFYICNWAAYGEALEGKMKFLPAPAHVDSLYDDYERMRGMIYGSIPDFDEIIQSLEGLEKDVNYMLERLKEKDDL